MYFYSGMLSLKLYICLNFILRFPWRCGREAQSSRRFKQLETHDKFYMCICIYIKKKLMKIMIYCNKIFRAYLQLIVVMTSKRSYVGVKSLIRVFSCSFFAKMLKYSLLQN